MGFAPGNNANPRGRPKKGEEEKAAAQAFIEGCKRLLPVALKRCEEILRDKESEPAACIRITEMLADRVMGKPAQAITGTDGGPIVLTWETPSPPAPCPKS